MSLLVAIGYNAFTETGSGGAQSGGLAPYAKAKAVVGAGGGQSGGAATLARSRSYPGAGGATSGGSAGVVKHKAPAPAGGGQSGGGAAPVREKAYAGTGGGQSAGAAAPNTYFIYRVGAGGGQSAGGAVQALAKTEVGGGGAQAGGAGVFVRAKAPAGSGGGQSGGAASALRSWTFAGSGGAELTGGVPYLANPELLWPDATGLQWPGGDVLEWPYRGAGIEVAKSYPALGSATLDGSLAVDRQRFYDGSGDGATLSGAALVETNVVPVTPEPPAPPAGGGWWGVPYWRPEPPKRRERKPTRKEAPKPPAPVHRRFVGSGGAVLGGGARVVFRPGAKPEGKPSRPPRPRADDEAAVMAAAELFGWGRAAPIRAYAEWNPSLHPRGQPENKGEFAPGGATGGKAKATAKAKVTTAPPPADRAKFVGQPVGKAEHVHAAAVEQEVARMLGRKAQWEPDNQPYDVSIPGEHAVEIKSLLKGSKQSLSVHDDALLRKIDYAQRSGEQYHTIAVDERATYEGGRYAGNYSGNRVFYKRGSARYSLSEMEPVKNPAHLRSLMVATDAELPTKARGSLPTDPAEVNRIRASAEKAHASRLAKDRARKARIKAARSPT
jgi:hypothetical protein